MSLEVIVMEYVPGIDFDFSFENEIGIATDNLEAIYQYFLKRHENENLAHKMAKAYILKSLSPYFCDISLIVPDAFYQECLGNIVYDESLSIYSMDSGIPEAVPENLITYQLNNYIIEQLEKLEVLIDKELSIENVHDIRVAIKRLLVVCTFYRAYLKKKFLALIDKLQVIFDSLGKIRDIDIMFELTGLTELKVKREKYQAKSCKLIARNRYDRMIAKTLKRKYLIKKISNCEGELLCFKADQVNRNVISSIRGRIYCAAVFFDKDYIPLCGYHRLRLVFKELKYVLEMCGYQDSEYVEQVKELTELLGSIHDEQNKILILKMAIEDTRVNELVVEFNQKFQNFIK